MASVEEAARGVIAALGSDVGYLLAAKWVADRYKQIFARVKARHLRRIGELYVPATVVAGTATMTRDNRFVSGDATARAAWDAVAGIDGAPGQTLVGRHIRSVITWYEIAAIEKDGGGLTQLRLKTPFAENTSTAGAYTIACRLNGLEPDVRWIGDAIVNMNRRMSLQRLSMEEASILSPAFDRAGAGQSIGQVAQIWSEVGDTIKDGKLVKTIHLYPYSSTSEIYHYVAYPTPPSLRFSDPLPPEIDEHVVREGALIDAMRHKMAQALAATPPRVEEAAVWRNEYRAQETRWEKIMLDAIRADHATDDLTFILQRAGWTSGQQDITNAWEMIVARWPR